MKVAPGYRLVAILVFGLVAACLRADAQVGFSATASAGSIGTNSSLTYTLFLTNTLGLPAFATNSLSGPVQLVSATASPTNNIFYSTNSTTAIFGIDPSISGALVQLTVTVQSTGTGSITNSISVGVPFQNITNVLFASLVTQVTNSVLPQADLAVSMNGPAQAVIANDYTSYGVTVSNLGPGDAPGVVLTNSLPLGVRFIPTGRAYTLSGSNVLFNLGTLTNGAAANVLLRVQPTNAGSLTFLASAGSPNVSDINPGNNSASTNISVGSYLSTNLVISDISAQQIDMLDGLMEQTILVSNAGPASVDSARVVVSGLSTTPLYNAVGTNNGRPFVVLGAPLDTNQAVQLLLQYYVPTHRAVSVSLQAFGVPAYDLSPPPFADAPVASVQILVPPTNSLPGSKALSFPSTPNRTYTVVYSDNIAFSNSYAAQPPVQAFANYTLWFDYGPPATVSHPITTAMRFYRVFPNPQP